jgi:hypothetical protein
MGKIIAAVAVLLAVPLTASAQDFGTEWLDRVVHERELDRGPLKQHAVEWTGSAGVDVFYDSNVLLRPTGVAGQKRVGDTVIVPFAGGRLDYSESRFEAWADILADYKYYLNKKYDTTNNLKHDNAFEERFDGHARYVDARWSAQADEIIRHDSDPTDVVFLNREERTISDTHGHGTYDFTRTVALEVDGTYEAVRYNAQPFKSEFDNENWRADGSLVYRQANGYDWLVQMGWIDIFYHHSQTGGAPPDASGYYVHGGFRGDVMERLSIQALLGWVHVESDRFLGSPNHVGITTADFQFNVRYELTQVLRVYGDLGRTVGFAGEDGSPFQTVTRFGLMGEWEAMEKLTIRGRIQWDHATTALGIASDYRSYSLTGAYKFAEHFMAELGGTYRNGESHGTVVASSHFNDAIAHLGVVFTY